MKYYNHNIFLHFSRFLSIILLLHQSRHIHAFLLSPNHATSSNTAKFHITTLPNNIVNKNNKNNAFNVAIDDYYSYLHGKKQCKLSTLSKTALYFSDGQVDEKLSTIALVISFLRDVRKNINKRTRNRIGGRRLRQNNNNHNYYYKPKWMYSKAFRGLTAWAFDVCDHDKNGRVYKEDLYTGVLLVHLHLSKYVGVAAANPLNRTQVEELFDLAAANNNNNNDSNNNNKVWIDQSAFQDIVVLSCVNIGGRIVVYYTMLMLLAPFLTTHIVNLARLGRKAIGVTTEPSHGLIAIFEWIVGHLVSVLVFANLVPLIYNHIEKASYTKFAADHIIPIRRRKQQQERKVNVTAVALDWWQRSVGNDNATKEENNDRMVQLLR